MKKNVLRKSNKNTTGSAIILALILTAILGLAAVGVFKSVRQYQSLNIKDIVATQLVLKSTFDYVSNGIKHRWCFDQVLAPSPSCEANASGNTERLTLSELGLRGRLKVSTLSDMNPNPRRPLVWKVPFSQMGSDHPLKFAVSQMLPEDSAGKALCITVRRLDKNDDYVKYLPGSNDESLGFLLTRASLISESRSCEADTRASPAIQSILAVYPRELNQFALVVANDLDLTRVGTEGNSSGGDFEIPAFDDIKVATASNVKGISFTSPIYVNRSLILTSGSEVRQDGSVHPVVPRVDFFAPVFIGNNIKLNTGTEINPFESQSAIPASWSSLPYSGLHRGIRIEANRDLGLDVLSGNFSPKSDLDAELFTKCLDEEKISVNLALTENSALLVKQESAPTQDSDYTTFTFRVGLSQKDRFIPINSIAPRANISAETTCDPTLGSCNEVVADDSRISVQTNSGFENLGSVLRVSLSPEFQGSNVQIETSLSTQSTITVPFGIQSRTSAGTSFVSTDQEIKLQLQPYKVDGHDQPDQVVMTLKVKGFTGSLDRLSLRLHPYTLGADAMSGAWTRSAEDRLMGTISFSPVDGQGLLADNFGSTSTSWKVSLPNADHFSTDATQEMNIPSDQSGRGAVLDACLSSQDWSSSTSSFLSGTRFSWDFALPEGFDRSAGQPLIQYFNSGTDSVFLVRSIVQDCEIESSARVVMGFMVCDNLTIQARTEPLEFIGTMIVAKTTKIHRSAVTAGVKFSSIHEPSAIKSLRAVGVLAAPTQQDVPWWHPSLSINYTAEMLNGLPGALRNLAVPFQWTAVDPDCGLVSGDTQTTCDHDVKNLVVSEFESRYDL